MLKLLLEPVRKYPVLNLLLFFHGIIIAVLVAYYYGQAETALWRSVLYVPVGWGAEGGRLYKIIARGPSLVLPWNLLPQHVLWVALDILIFGSLSIWWTWWMVGDELRLAARESETVKRELEAQAIVEGKDAEVKKMSTALARLKTELAELRKRSRG